MGNEFYRFGENQTNAYVKYILANSCMPTLLGVKPSCMVTVMKKYTENLHILIQMLENEIHVFQCEYQVMYEDELSYTLFLYHPESMKQILKNEECHPLLMNYGYHFTDSVIKDTIERLMSRYAEYKTLNREFPHELGVLLGYPIDDVIAYIRNEGKNYKACGYWKVYYNVEQAEELFAFFKLVREEAMQILCSGRQLMEMKTFYGQSRSLAMVC